MGRREEFTVGNLYVTGQILMGNAVAQPLTARDNLLTPSFISLGAPAVAVTNRFVTTTNMKVGAYTVANARPADNSIRNVTVTHTQVGGVDDTLGTIIVTGTDYFGAALTETITPLSGTIASGLKCFKTVTGVTGAGWVINTGNDTLVVGFGGLVQIPVLLAASSDILLTIFDAAVINAPTVTVDANYISLNTIDASGLTYNGTKTLKMLVNLA